MKTHTTKYVTTYLLAGLISTFLSCEKFIEIDPPKTQIINTVIFDNDQSAISAIRGIYSTMISSNNLASGGLSSITVLCGLSADELINYSVLPERASFYTNSIQPSNSILTNSLWSEAYKYIYFANSALEGISQSQGMSDPVKKQLQGEALFVRSFANFYLVNLFAEVPIVLTTDYRINAVNKCEPTDKVYGQIESDLIQAIRLLSEDYTYSNGEKTRVNKWAATALLARVYLYQKKWRSAEEQSNLLITSEKFKLSKNLNTIFLKNSEEAILQLMTTSANLNTPDGQAFILTTTPNNIALDPDQVKSFENGDLRKSSWIDSITIGSNKYYYPFKYKLRVGTVPLSEYSMVLRLAEQYLIRAEARIMQDNLKAGISDLNSLRERARAAVSSSLPNPLPPLSMELTKSEALQAVENERRNELFSEWGHRWFDLKRTGRADKVLSIKKGANWQTNDARYPIPQTEIDKNSNLTQNQ